MNAVANTDGSGWGDIFFSLRGATEKKMNWTTAGKAIFGINASGVRVTPASFDSDGNGTADKQACRAMSPLEFIQSETELVADGGPGKSLSSVISDLDDQGADEDKSILSNLGQSSWANWFSSIGSPASLSTANQNALTTAQNTSPAATTSAATSVGNTSAVLNGSLAQNSFGTGLTIYFE